VGEAALAKARVILNEADELVQAARSAGQPLTGRFRLGVIPTIAPFLLPAALPLLRTRFPELRLYLREDLTQRLIAALKSGQLDAALIALPFDMTGLDSAHVAHDEILAALPANHPLSRQDRTRPSELEEGDLILLEDGHCLREQALDVCHLAGASEKDGFRATSLETLRQMVAAGVGMTLLPVLAVKPPVPPQPNLRLLPFAAPAPKRRIALFWRKSSARATFLRGFADVLARLPAELLRLEARE
jgi:LysR family hydrogen peroxide-inducible transcriptional activator